MTEDFNKTENSTFYIKKGGVYYVSANLIILAEKVGSYHYYPSTVTVNGEIHLSSDQGMLKTLESYYIKNTHTAMIEGLDNRTRIPYYTRQKNAEPAAQQD